MTQGSHYIMKDRLKLSMLEGGGASLGGEREKLLTVGSYYVHCEGQLFPWDTCTKSSPSSSASCPYPPPHPTPIPFVFLPSLLLILFSSPPTSAPHPLLFSPPLPFSLPLPCLAPFSPQTTSSKELDIGTYSHQSVDRFAVLLDLWTAETQYLELKMKVTQDL